MAVKTAKVSQYHNWCLRLQNARMTIIINPKATAAALALPEPL